MNGTGPERRDARYAGRAQCSHLLEKVTASGRMLVHVDPLATRFRELYADPGNSATGPIIEVGLTSLLGAVKDRLAPCPTHGPHDARSFPMAFEISATGIATLTFSTATAQSRARRQMTLPQALEANAVTSLEEL